MPTIGVLNFEDRYKQTIETFISIREKTKDSIILFSDSSVHKLDAEKIENIKSKVDIFLDFNNNEQAQQINQSRNLSESAIKSLGENFLLLQSILHLKSLYDFKNLEGRMFKFGGRCSFRDSFDLKDYDNTFGKFVFKKRVDSWMPENVQKTYGSTHILETRLYSWCFSLVDDYIRVIYKNFELMNIGFDTEHAHFLNIPSDKLLEFDNIWVEGQGALHGKYQKD